MLEKFLFKDLLPFKLKLKTRNFVFKTALNLYNKGYLANFTLKKFKEKYFGTLGKGFENIYVITCN